MIKRAGNLPVLENLATLPADSSVLMLRGDFLYDERIIKRLTHEENVLLQTTVKQDTIPVAAVVGSQYAPQTQSLLSKQPSTETIPNIQTVHLIDWAAGFQEQLRKFEPPYVLPITEDRQDAFEEHLYSGSYKGVTDLITKWAWPIPAKWAVHLCVKLGITPNMVTAFGVCLTVIAGISFMSGQFVVGLVAGWLMTFLDTVDGKLARVTVTSSKFGHVLDHGTDIIHPPLWYIAWGLGLAAFTPLAPWLSLHTIFGIILLGYILGRLCEGLFQLCLGQFGMFCWRPFDSFNRLITARRNPNLILLTASLCIGHPDWGLLAVTAWTVLSTLLLLLRLCLAFGVRIISGQPLRPWLADIGTVIDHESLAAKTFTRPPLTTSIQSTD
ncbi:MAG: CDP-alcohol phosphatidyltransferase family protein [Nitrospirales bacterium]